MIESLCRIKRNYHPGEDKTPHLFQVLLLPFGLKPFNLGQ